MPATMTDLAAVCDDLAEWLPRAAALTAIPDTTPGGGRHHQESRPPWNPAAATAVYDALETIRRAEQELRSELAGRYVHRRPHAATGHLLEQIPRLAEALPAMGAHITAELHRRLSAILQLDGIGEQEPVRRITGARCPYCGAQTILIMAMSALVACGDPGCRDSNGQRPRGALAAGAASGQPLIAWADGITQHPQAAA
jgi:hypothetical protein